MTTATSPRSNAVRAALWMIGALLGFCVMAVAIRELSGRHGTFEILAYRSIIGIIVVGGIALAMGRQVVRTRQMRWQVRRNLVHFVGQAGWTYGLGVLPFATVFSIEFTMPAWTAVLAVLFLRERMTRGRLIAIVGGIVGVVVILRPDVALPDPSALIVLGAAIAYAGAHIMTKQLTHSDGPLAILFWMSVMQLPLSLVFIGLGDGWRMPSVVDMPWIAAVGLAALAAHFCLARALSFADAIVVMSLDFARLPLIALVGALLYGEVLNVGVGIGAVIIAVSLMVSLHTERRA
ncbi:MAG: DMT family transporter [Alphaproteobacteria bacterium]